MILSPVDRLSPPARRLLPINQKTLCLVNESTIDRWQAIFFGEISLTPKGKFFRQTRIVSWLCLRWNCVLLEVRLYFSAPVNRTGSLCPSPC